MTIQQFSAGQTLTAAQMNTLQASDFNYTLNTQSGGSYTLVASDLGKLVRFTNSGAITLTVPTDASVSFDVGDRISLLLDSTGTLTVQGASGVSVSAEGSVFQLNTRYSLATLVKLDANSWMLTGVMMNTITDGEVTESKIASGAVTESKIGSGAVTEAKLGTGAVTSAKIADGTIVNADVNASAGIALSKLATGSSAQLVVHDGSGVPTATTVTGDVTISSTGVTSISSGAIVNADISASAGIALSKLASGGAAQVVLHNGSGVPTATALTGDVTVDATGITAISSGVIVNADISSTAAVDIGKIADVAIDTKTANYTLALTDKNKFIEMNLASANTVSVPTNGSVAFPVGSQIHITQYGAGKTQIVAVTPATTTIRSTPSAGNGAYLRAQYSSATLIKRATDEWYLVGDLSAT